jgi:hypothetical protein
MSTTLASIVTWTTLEVSTDMAYDPSTDAPVTVVATFPKAADLWTHILLVDLPNGQIIEFRDYVPSTGRYGRGYWMPVEALDNAVAGLGNIQTVEEPTAAPVAAGRRR